MSPVIHDLIILLCTCRVCNYVRTYAATCVYILCIIYVYIGITVKTAIKFFIETGEAGAKTDKTYDQSHDGYKHTTTTTDSAATANTKTPALHYDYARTGPVSVRHVLNIH